MPWRTCQDCSSKLGLFKRKYKCRKCTSDFCDACFSKVKTHRAALHNKLSTGELAHSCLRCVVFAETNFKRRNLFLLTSRQLSDYLFDKKISTTHCTEKHHLVDLIMEFAELKGFKSVTDIEHDLVHRHEIEQLRQAEIKRQQELRNTPRPVQRNTPQDVERNTSQGVDQSTSAETTTTNLQNDNLTNSQTTDSQTSDGISNENRFSNEKDNLDNDKTNLRNSAPCETIEQPHENEGFENVSDNNLSSENPDENAIGPNVRTINVEEIDSTTINTEQTDNSTINVEEIDSLTINTEGIDSATMNTEEIDSSTINIDELDGSISNESPNHSSRSNNRYSYASPTITSNLSQSASSSTSASLNQSQGKWKSVEDINDASEIPFLSVLELKQILRANFIDYRGCCEKRELVNKVCMLYDSEKKGSEAADALGGGEGGERDVCKICMDRIIDCVLLDCGHLVACTKCGKRLHECPICRALVVRVVHIFRV